jgi:hypothetical protein
MRQKPVFTVAVLLMAMVVSQAFGPLLSAQTALPTPQELDQLLAPVALYPDSLLSQITTASTNPQEILDVNSWLQQNSGLTGAALTDAAQQQGFDPAFIALVVFPDVLDMMAEHIDDYAAIGQAFSADQASVTDSIQRLRAQAYEAGSLRSNEQLQVDVQQPAGQTVYVIQPANPQIVYVPVYDPTVVYIRPTHTVVATSLISFGVGIGIGALLVDNQPWGWGGWGWNWGSRRAYYNHGYWGGWSNPYHPPHIVYRPRPIVWANRPGYRGNWGYRPPHYRPPNRPGRPGPGRPGRPGGHKPAPPPSKPGIPNKPGRPNPTKPGTPDRPPHRPPAKPDQGNKPSRPRPERPSRPGQTKPGENKPGKPGETKPDQKPGRPSGRPAGRPSGQPGKPETPGQTRPGRPAPSKPDQNKPTTPDRNPNKPAGRPGKPETSPGQGRPQPNRPAGKPAAQPKPATGGRPQRQEKPAEKPENKAETPR